MSFTQSEKQYFRLYPFYLRYIVQIIVKYFNNDEIPAYRRILSCGYPVSDVKLGFNSVNGSVKILGGVLTCSNTWACPVCSQKFASEKKELLNRIVDKWVERGDSYTFLTLTVNHCLGDSLSDVQFRFNKTLTAFFSGNSYLKIKEKYCIKAIARNVECTHGSHGWHYHSHVLVFHAGGVVLDFDVFADRWLHVANRNGFLPNKQAFHLQNASGSELANYLSKWSASSELANSSFKFAGGSSATPLQILQYYENSASAYYHNKNNVDYIKFIYNASLYHEYLTAMRNKKHIYITKNFARSLGVIDDIESENEVETYEHTLLIPRLDYFAVVSRGKLFQYLQNLENYYITKKQDTNVLIEV